MLNIRKGPPCPARFTDVPLFSSPMKQTIQARSAATTFRSRLSAPYTAQRCRYASALWARGALSYVLPLSLTRRLCYLVEHIDRAGLQRLAAEIFADLAPHIRFADFRSLAQH